MQPFVWSTICRPISRTRWQLLLASPLQHKTCSEASESDQLRVMHIARWPKYVYVDSHFGLRDRSSGLVLTIIWFGHVSFPNYFRGHLIIACDPRANPGSDTMCDLHFKSRQHSCSLGLSTSSLIQCRAAKCGPVDHSRAHPYASCLNLWKKNVNVIVMQ